MEIAFCIDKYLTYVSVTKSEGTTRYEKSHLEEDFGFFSFQTMKYR